MNLNEFVKNNGLKTVPNPLYNKRSKKNKQPAFIQVVDTSGQETDPLVAARSDKFAEEWSVPTKDVEKYSEYGLTYNKVSKNLDAELADAQSNWKKAGNALAQTLVSEIGLGTLKGFSDLADFVIGGAMRINNGEDNDYTNPVSQVLEKAQEDFKEFAPIYSTPDVSIDNGGLADFSWWMSNIPSIASSLTLLLPARVTTAGVSKLGALAKATNIGRKASVASRRFLGNVMRGQTNLKRAEEMARFGAEGTIMRIAENYQESRQTYNDMYPKAYEALNDMTPEEYQNYIETHKDILGDNIDFNNKSDVAKRIASYSADETFKDDMFNAVFDIYQLYGLRNIGRIMNSPGRASVRRLDKLSRKFPNKSKEEIQAILNNRSNLRKAWDWTTDIARGSGIAITSELSEGVEEAVNYAAQQEGLSYGQALLTKGFNESTGEYNLTEEEKDKLKRGSFFSKNRLVPFSRITMQALADYAKAPELHDSAFWGVLGGIAFGGAGSGINKISQAYKAYNTKKELLKAGVDESQIPTYTELMQTPEIQARIANIENRHVKWEELKSKLKSIKDNHIDPLNPDKILETEDERELARRRAIEDHDISLLLSAMDVGHWNITKAYLESDGVRDGLVEAGIMNDKEARERQTQIKTLADRIEKLYNNNLKTIDNALSRYSDDGKDLSDIPIEVFGLVARYNIAHQIAADRLRDDYISTETATTEEEKRVEAQLAGMGMNVKQLIETRVQAQALGELMAERKEIANGKDAATLTGQMQLDMLDKKIDIVKQELFRNVRSLEDYARVLDAMRFASGVRKKDDSYYFDEYDGNFKAIDDAIKNGDIKALKNLGVFGTLQDNAQFDNLLHIVSEDGTEQNLEFDAINSELDLLSNSYDILYNTDAKRTISNLEDISKVLSDNYHNLAAISLQRVLELSNIAVTKEDVAKEVDRINNTMAESGRPALLNHAMEGLQHLAKKYGKDKVLEELNNTFNGKPKGSAYVNFTQNEKRFFDDYVRLMALDKSINNNLYRRAVKAIQLNDIYEFTTTEDIFEPRKEKTESSSTSKETISEGSTSSPITTSPTPIGEVLAAESEEIEEKEDKETPKEKTSKVAIRAEINDNNPSGLAIDTVAEDNTGIDALEDEDGNVTLDFINADDDALENWIVDSELWNINGDKNAEGVELEVVKNPVVKRTDAGLEVIEKGTINATIPSTGEEERPSGRSTETRADEDDLAARAAEFESDDLGPDIAQAIMDYIMSNDTYNYNDVAAYLRDKFKDRDQTKLESLLEDFIANQAELAESVGRNVEAVAIAKVVAFSSLNDTARRVEDKKKIQGLLDNAFKEILANYAKHSALDFDAVNGKYILSLENLLRYCTDVTENKEDADKLYSILKDAIDRSEEYVTIDGTTPVAELIANAKKDYEQRKAELSDAHNATSINIKRYIGRLVAQLNDEKTSEGDKESLRRQLEDIYDALDNANPGDNLVHVNQSGNGQTGIDFFITNSKGIDIKIGEIPTPKSINGGTHWEMNNMGWLTDVPKGDGSSKFQKVITRILVPEESDTVAKEINELLREYIAKGGNKLLAHKIMDLVRSDAELKERLNNKLSNSLNNMCVKHLADLYNYVKQINDMFLQTYGLTREQAEEALRDNRLESIQNWMDKLKVSYNNAEYLHNAPDIPIKIQSIAEGNAIVTDTQRPVSKAVGSEHKGLVHIGIVTFDKPGEITIAGGATVKNNFGKVGTPILTIAGAHNAVAQIQVTTQTLNSSNFRGNATIKAIRDDVMSELEKYLDSWGETHDNAEILDFIRKLVDRKYGSNVPLFQGISVEPLTGGFSGFQLTYTTKDGKTHYTKFFNAQTVNGSTYPVSNVRFEIKNETGNVRGISLNPKAKDQAARKQAIKDLKEHLKECLKFNIDFAYVNSDNSNIPVQGFATRKDGKFVINITGNKEYTFNSFNDFILDNDVINAATQPNSHGKNFNRPGEGGFMDSNGLTYAIDDGTEDNSPVEKIEKETTPYRKRGDEVVNLVSKSIGKTLFGELKADTKANLSKEILKVLLNGKQLNILNNSGIISKLLHKNVIFVEDYNDLTYETKRRDDKGNIITVTEKVPDSAKAAYHKESVTYKKSDGTEITIAADTIVISPKWVENANGTLEQQEQAARDILHENVHRVLTFPENAGWIDKAQAILNNFKNANLTDENDIKIRNAYSQLSLEEFLVESLTRPELMNVLNKIPTDVPIGGKAKLKKGNLLQRILKLVSELFGVNVNENSLLEKEFKLFEDLGKTAAPKAKPTAPIAPAAPAPTAPTNPAEAAQQSVQNTGGRRRKVDFSTRNDMRFASKSSIESKLENYDKEWFNNAVNNGLISITCK